MSEIWKDVPGYEGRYQISTLGRLYSLKARRLLTPRKHTHGYLQYVLSKNNRAKYPLAHRLVALAFIPNPENKTQVNHINGNKSDNRVENLEWCTNAENTQHRYDVLNKRRNSGKPVICIETGETYQTATEAARKLGLERSLISRCCRGESKHIKNLHFKFMEDFA